MVSFLGVALQATEVEQHACLVADDPRIVPRRHVKGVAGRMRSSRAPLPSSISGAITTFQDITDVLDLARVGARERLSHSVAGQRRTGFERPEADRCPFRSTSSTRPFASVNSRTSSGLSKRFRQALP